MQKILIAFFGALLFVFSWRFNASLDNGKKEAVSKDKTDQNYGIVEDPLPCKWSVEEPERVQSENKSQSVLIKVVNDYPDEECESAVSLRAPGFDVSPVKEEQKINLKPNTEGSMSWIISPKKAGSYEIAISDPLNSKVYGINVTNMFGFSAVQAKTASFVGTIFGPMLTVPWWWEKWFQKRKKKEPMPQKEVEEREKENE